MLILIDFLLVFFFAWITVTLLGIREKPAGYIGWFLLVCANIVFTTEFLSFLGSINQKGFLISHLVLLAAALVFWWVNGRPSLTKLLINGPTVQNLPIREAFAGFFRCHLPLFVLLISVGFGYLVIGILAVSLPPNNVDSMTYHLSRIGFWMQHESLLPWATGNPRQVTSPINAEVLAMWPMLFLHSDRMAGLLQWSAALISALAIYGIARDRNASQTQALFAAIIWATFPQIALQSSSTQNDLVTASFLIAAVYFLLKMLSERQNKWLILSAVAIGLGAGTKVTFLMTLVGTGAAVGLIWLLKVDARSILFRWGMACLISTALLGSYTYIQNYLFFRNFLDDGSITGFVSQIRSSKVDMLVGHTTLYAFQAVDLSGLPQFLFSPLQEGKAKLASFLIRPIKGVINRALQFSSWSTESILYFPLRIHEDLSWFGVLAFILLLPLILIMFREALRRKDNYLILSTISFIGFTLILILFLNWSPYRSRYWVPVVTLCAPMLALLYPRTESARSIKVYGISFIAIIILLNLVFYNQSKPLFGSNAIWGKNRVQIQTINRTGMLPIYQMVEGYVPENSRLVLETGMEGWDYLFFGPNFQRTVLTIDSEAFLDVQDLQQKNADYLLIEPHQRNFLSLPDGLYWVDQTNGWILLTLHPERARTESVDQALLIGASDSRNLMSVAPGLVGKVGIIELLPSAWDIEEYEGSSILWLGDDIGYGLNIYLWSDTDRPVRLQVDAVPGPSRHDPGRTLRLYQINRNSQVFNDQSITGPGVLEFDVNLQKGSNRLILAVQDQVQIFAQPNGDMRPLLLLVKHINVLP